jgi:hypothetical protein
VDGLFASLQQMAETLKLGGTVNKYRALVKRVLSMHDSVRRGERGNTADFWMMMAKLLIQQNFEALRDFHDNAPL